MNKKSLIVGTIALFITWSVMDFLIHGLWLNSTYMATAHLWRPMEEMKMGLMNFVVLISTICYVLLYAKGFSKQGVSGAIQFGALFGVGVGISMGLGTYSVQDIPMNLAVSWMLGTIAEAVVGALVLHLVFSKLK